MFSQQFQNLTVLNPVTHLLDVSLRPNAQSHDDLMFVDFDESSGDD